MISFITKTWLSPSVSMLFLFTVFCPCNINHYYSLIMSTIFLFSTFQSDELSFQKKLRTEVIQLEDTLAQVRKEYEMLRIEFEQNLAANEQAGKKNIFTSS